MITFPNEMRSGFVTEKNIWTVENHNHHCKYHPVCLFVHLP